MRRSLRSRLDRLEAALTPSECLPKSVIILPDDGPDVAWETPTGLQLSVPSAAWRDPYAALTIAQRGLIRPHDSVVVLCMPPNGRD